MLRVALTGGIATGKSYCLERFAALGAATIGTDRNGRAFVSLINLNAENAYRVAIRGAKK